MCFFLALLQNHKRLCAQFESAPEPQQQTKQSAAEQ